MKYFYTSIFSCCMLLTLFITPSTYAQISSSESALQGAWKNISIQVDIATYKGSDSAAAFVATEDNWDEKMKIKPIKTHFRENGTYVSRYFTPGDSLVMERRGDWEVDGDTLVMQEMQPDETTYVTKFNVEGDTARFETLMDWDQDGEKDDRYTGVQVRISESE